MAKTIISGSVSFRVVAMVAGMLGLCGPSGAQSRVRAGVSVRVPIHTHPLSEGDKTAINGLLMFVLALVVVAVVGIGLIFLYCLLADAWGRACKRLRAWHWQERDLLPYLPPQGTRPSDPKRRKIEIERARIRKQEWEERTAQVRRENADGETQDLTERLGTASYADHCP